MNVPVSASPLVSVITPVYNGERYLPACIESVLGQTYTNFEYLIADNCSTDGTAAIAEAYARRDARIRYWRNERFVSAPENHNLALARMSTGSKYCKFVHADDWIFPECLARMVAVAEAHPSVGVVGAYRLDDVRVNLDGLSYPSPIVLGGELARATLLGRLYVFGSPTSVLFRCDLATALPRLFDDTRFPRHSDSSACLELLRKSDFGFVHQVLTYTRRPAEARTSVSRHLNSYLAEAVVAVSVYGPEFLTPSEYEQRHGELLARYRSFLGSNLLGADRAFWEYHDAVLATLGLRREPARFVAAALGALTANAFRPVRRVARGVPRAVRAALRPARSARC